MQPWTILALLIGVGFVTLLIAPTIHRRINTNSRAEAEAQRVDRARERRSGGAATRSLNSARECLRLRDRLLLRGVRAEVLEDDGGWVLLFDPQDAAIVDAAIGELDTE